MMAFENSARQIVELLPTGFAAIALPMGLMGMKAAFVDDPGIAMRATNPVRPAQFAHFFKTSCIIDQVVYV